MKIDGVFSGGGVKAFAFIGALESVQEKQFTFERVAGTSAGAITAGLIAAGYKAEEIKLLFDDLNLKKFMDPILGGKVLPFAKWLFLYFTMGLYKGDKFEKWLYEKLAQKGIYTFNDLPYGRLKVVAADLTLGRIVVFPDDVERLYAIDPGTFLVSKAIRMSAGIPYFFIPKKINGKKGQQSLLVDGGVLSNFPVWVFENRNKNRMRPILGMKLSDSIEHMESNEIHNSLEMFHALFSTMMQAHDTRYISKSEAADIIFIPVKNVQTANLELSEDKKKTLIELGKKRADSFLSHWP